MTPQRAATIVWKLRRLAASSSPCEAASARVQAQTLIDRYQLTDVHLAFAQPSERAGLAEYAERMQRVRDAVDASLARLQEETRHHMQQAEYFAQRVSRRQASRTKRRR